MDMEQNNETNQDTEQVNEHGPFTMRKRIRSTTYEVYVYFSRTNRETLGDKILRMARNEAERK